MTPSEFYFVVTAGEVGRVFKAQLITPGGNLYLVSPAGDDRAAERRYLTRENVAELLRWDTWRTVPAPPKEGPHVGKTEQTV